MIFWRKWNVIPRCLSKDISIFEHILGGCSPYDDHQPIWVHSLFATTSLRVVSHFQVWGVPTEEVVVRETVRSRGLWVAHPSSQDHHRQVQWERSGECHHGHATQVQSVGTSVLAVGERVSKVVALNWFWIATQIWPRPWSCDPLHWIARYESSFTLWEKSSM